MVERWSPSEQRILQSLDSAVFSSRAGAALAPICERVLTTLARGPREIEAWEPVPLDLYGTALPQEIPAEELIEERPDPADPDPFHPHRTRRRKYADVAQP